MISQPIISSIATTGILATAVWRTWKLFRREKSRLDNPVLFFGLIGVFFLALRWPLIMWPHDLNMDESQLLAEGMLFTARHVPWRDVDGTTSGPLNYIFFSTPLIFGAPVSWVTARIALWAMQCVTMMVLYGALRTFGSKAEAQFALLPTISFYAFAIYSEFVHYSSETLPVLLLAMGIYLLCQEWNANEPSVERLFVVGCLAGAAPFAKLQVMPLVAFLCAVGMALAWSQYWRLHALRKNWWRPCVAVCAGGLVFPAVFLAMVCVSGAFHDFWNSYILAAAAYSARESFDQKFQNLCLLLGFRSDFKDYFNSAVAALVLLLLAWRGRMALLGRELFWPLVVVFLDCIATLFCCFVAGKPFFHYTFLMVPPLTMLFGLAFFGGKKILDARLAEKPVRPWVWKTVFVACGVLVIGMQYDRVPLFLRHARDYVPVAGDSRVSMISRYIFAPTEPGDTLSIWGWTPKYYVETGLLPATRDTIHHYIISKGPYQDYFRTRYLNDLKRNPPAEFMDAVANGMFRWDWTDKDTHESFPELNQFINENYSLWTTIRLTNATIVGSPIRIYVRNDRMAEKHLTPQEVRLPPGVNENLW